MIVTSYRHADAFLEKAQSALEANEAANSFMLSVCLRLKRFPERIESDPYLITVEDSQGLVMAAVMTPPHKIIVGGNRLNLADATAIIIQDLLTRRWRVPGVVGPSEVAYVFAENWSRIAGDKIEERATRRICKMTKLISPPSISGHLRVATERDIELLTRWIHAFRKETRMQGDLIKAFKIAKRMISERNVFLWEDQKLVSMSAKVRTTPNGVAVDYVYTPPLFRRKGYATACLASLGQRLLNLGWRFCILYSSSSEIAFNQKIIDDVGFVPVCDFAEYSFSGE